MDGYLLETSVLSARPILRFPAGLGELVRNYTQLIREAHSSLSAEPLGRAARLLTEIDAIVLAAYDLPPRMEKELLEFFRGHRRPVAHGWEHWFPKGMTANISLVEYLSPEFKKAASRWLLEVFRPLPESEAALLEAYLE